MKGFVPDPPVKHLNRFFQLVPHFEVYLCCSSADCLHQQQEQPVENPDEQMPLEQAPPVVEERVHSSVDWEVLIIS
jgi:hypothetical protein